MAKFKTEWLKSRQNHGLVSSVDPELKLVIEFGKKAYLPIRILCKTCHDTCHDKILINCYACEKFYFPAQSSEENASCLESEFSKILNLDPFELHLFCFDLEEYITHQINNAKLILKREEKNRNRKLLKEYKSRGYSSSMARTEATRNGYYL